MTIYVKYICDICKEETVDEDVCGVIIEERKLVFVDASKRDAKAHVCHPCSRMLEARFPS